MLEVLLRISRPSHRADESLLIVFTINWYEFFYDCVGTFNYCLLTTFLSSGLSFLNALPDSDDVTACAEVERNQPTTVQLCRGTG